MGIYTRVFTREIKCKKSFKGTSRLINTCLGTQIVVAAALTALGAANGSRSAVTVFGEFIVVVPKSRPDDSSQAQSTPSLLDSSRT